MTEMDYFAQKPEMDMKSFFESKGLRIAAATDPVPVGCAPPPKDTAWVASADSTAEVN
jgi:hypothetical protein